MTEAATNADAGSDASETGQALPRAIAVDGSAASGKSTIGRRLASTLGYRFLDTGVMYRAVTHAALAAGIAVEDAVALTSLANRLQLEVSLSSPEGPDNERVYVNGSDVTESLRSSEVEANVSLVSRVAGVRDALVKKQRDIAARQPIVMAGRDIGTVVLPNADIKVYLDASLEERSRRRHEEFSHTGRGATAAEVMDDIRRRDQIDIEREVSPLRPAEDAIVIQTDGRRVEDIIRQVIDLATTASK
jgi:cytidylate kinase